MFYPKFTMDEADLFGGPAYHQDGVDATVPEIVDAFPLD